MKRLLFIALATVFVACGESEESNDTNEQSEETVESTEENAEEEFVHVNTPTIEPGVVGMFELGAKVPTLPEDLNSRVGTASAGEGEEIRTTVIYNSYEDMVDLHMEDNPDGHMEDLHIVEMIVHSDYYQTADKVGVGSTVEHFAEVYPDYEIWHTYVSDRYVLETESLIGVQFLLDFHDCKVTPKNDSEMQALQLTDFREGAKIQSIRVY